jgi:hypothetical protein
MLEAARSIGPIPVGSGDTADGDLILMRLQRCHDEVPDLHQPADAPQLARPIADASTRCLWVGSDDTLPQFVASPARRQIVQLGPADDNEPIPKSRLLALASPPGTDHPRRRHGSLTRKDSVNRWQRAATPCTRPRLMADESSDEGPLWAEAAKVRRPCYPLIGNWCHLRVMPTEIVLGSYVLSRHDQTGITAATFDRDYAM